jgi:hypothetical protein
MITLLARLTLLSDAEPGTGLGTDMIHDVVPRGVDGRPCLPAPHLKGLIRDKLQQLGAWRDWIPAHVDALLGSEGAEGDDGSASRIRVGEGRPVGSAARNPFLLVHRTALGASGTVLGGALRTVEAIAAKSEFEFKVRVDAEPGDARDLLARLGLLALDAVGAHRNRGAGRCLVRIEGERRTPGQLLLAVDELLSRQPAPRQVQPQVDAAGALASGRTVWRRVLFTADGPVCCPETPVVSNVIRSGPVIPASAVQGAVLSAIDRIDSKLATSCLHDDRFRAWPLVPVAIAGDPVDPNVLGLRVDLAHRMSKLPQVSSDLSHSEEHAFADPAVDPERWAHIAGSSVLRSNDGILRIDSEGISLWRAQDLPRMFGAHGVHYDPRGERGRNLFTVESLAPMVFVGLLALPVEAAEALDRALAADSFVSFGKARTVRGGGTLEVRAAGAELFGRLHGRAADSEGARVFVVQSPLEVPDDWHVDVAEDVLARLASERGWGRVVGEMRVQDRSAARTQAHCGVRFGWNRHGLGARVGDQRRLRARRVILPGSVLVLEQPVADLEAALLAGLGAGREQGFGALLPHPGVATRKAGAAGRLDLPTLKSRDDGARLALEWFRACRDGGPSPSQIARVHQLLEVDSAKALEYFRKQKKARPLPVWNAWKSVYQSLESQLEQSLQSERTRALTRQALRIWQDLAIAGRNKGAL